MTISKIAELLLAICFLFLGATAGSAVVVVNFAFIYGLVYRIIRKLASLSDYQKESDNEDH